MWKNFKDSLPWLVPSVAIVIGASGVLDRDLFSSWLPNRDQPAATVESVAPAQPAPAPVVAAAPAPVVQAPQPDADVVARQSSASLLLEQVSAAPVITERAQVVTPQPEQSSEARERQRALAAASARTPTFGSGNVTSSAQAQCIADLKQLASEARVYFPSGGTSADAAGIEQGRLLGLVVQNCPDVRIRVEGHSDASGDPGANLRLSRARAEEVIKRIGASGLDTSMFVAEGLGDRNPSGLVGPQPRAYYDRRVEFKVLEDTVQVAARGPVQPQPWADASCVADLERAVQGTVLFYAPGSVSLRAEDVDTAFQLAEQAMQCPQARLRVVGRYADNVNPRETTSTGLLRAKALMAMLVARGATSEQIIIAAPSRAAPSATVSGLPGHRVNFDVIYEDG